MKQILIDTNIIIGLLNTTSIHHERAKNDIKKLLDEDYDLFICSQILRECYKVMTTPTTANGLGLNPDVAHEEIQNLIKTYEMTEDSNSSFVRWRFLVSSYKVSGKNTHDTHIVACMLVNGIDTILTYNPTDFRRFNSLITVHS